jgi:hypothetical protein
MTKIIKDVTLKEVAELQAAGPTQVIDLLNMTVDLYARIIINCSVGPGYSQKKVKFEQEDGSLIDVSIQYAID